MKSARSSKSKHHPKSKAHSVKGMIRPASAMPVVHPHAAGIDVGATEHFVCVPEDSVVPGQSPVRSFSAFTGDLDKLVEWLQECKVKTVAMESTGVYWIALCQKLEAAGLEVVLANARHLRQVPGRKTDVKDCQWLQRLHSYGMLNGSFRPADQFCRFRTLMRHRENLVDGCGQQVQHMQKALNYMNVHLHHAVSDLNGQTGLRILDAILAGQRDPEVLVALRDDRIKRSTPEEMKAALQGDWREEHLFVLRQARQHYAFLEEQISQCDKEIEQVLAQIIVEPVAASAEDAPANPPASSEPKARKKKHRTRKTGHGLKKDLSSELQRICGVDLTQVIGLNVLSVMIILSEIGVDMSRWRSAKAFSSWLGLNPGNKISGGKVLSSRTPHVVNRVSILLRTLATAVGRSDTWLGVFHRRMKARLGPAGANTATARKLACLIYHLLKYKEGYIDVDVLIYSEKIQRQRLGRLRKTAEELGYQLLPLQQAA
jgi:transposase